MISWTRRHRASVLVFVWLLLILTSCGQDSANSTLPSVSTATSTDIPVPTPIPTKTLSLSEQIQRVTLTAIQALDLRGAHATVVVDNGAVTEMELLNDCCARIDDIHLECFNLMQATWHDSMSSHIKSVDIHLTANLVDRYGHPSIGDVGQCTLTSDTEKQFVWENLDQDSAWNVYDYTWTLPGL
jgi:hypothetical protein